MGCEILISSGLRKLRRLVSEHRFASPQAMSVSG